jgi:hypothetical protein
MDVLVGTRVNVVSRFILITILASVLLYVDGCATDITYSPKYGFGSLAGHRFIITGDCQLDGLANGADFVLYGVSPRDDSGDPIPRSIQEYLSQIQRKGYATLPAGTVLQIKKITYTAWTGSDPFLAYGSIASGPLTGKTVCVTSFVKSQQIDDKAVVQIPNPDAFREYKDGSIR